MNSDYTDYTDYTDWLMLIYGASRAAVRPMVLVAAGASKLVFISLVLMHGSRFLAQPVRVSIAVDVAMILLFAAYLVHGRGQVTNRQS